MDVFGAIVFLILGLIVFYGPVRTILKARKSNIRLSFLQALALWIKKTDSTQLFQAIAMAKEYTLNVNRLDLETHLIAGGDPVRVVKTLIKYKSYQEISPKQVFAHDLSKMDFDAFASQLLKTHTVTLEKLDFSEFKIDYKAVFKLSSDSLLLNAENDNMENRVKHILKQLSQSWSPVDRQYTENFLKTQVFNDRFWNDEIKAKLISQKLTVYE